MSKPVDVFITESELAQGRKAKRTTCMKVDKEIMKPVHCVSRPGISTGTMFTRSEPLRTGRYLTDYEMTAMYDKFVGPSSLNSAAVRLENEERDVIPSPSTSTAASNRTSRVPYVESGDRTPPPPAASVAVAMAAAGVIAPSQVRPPAVDAEAAERSATVATMKYVAPKIAKKYGIVQSITPAGSRAAAAAAAARSGGGRGAAGGGRAAAGPGGDRPLESGASFSSGGDGRPPRPRSAAFSTTSREQAARTGSHFTFGGPSDVPPPGKYTPKYGAMDKAQHAPVWSRPQSGSRAAGEDGAGGASRSRPGSAPSGSGTRGSRPSSAPTHRASADDGATDPWVPNAGVDAQAAQAGAAQAQGPGHPSTGAAAAELPPPPPPQARRGLSRSLSSHGPGGAPRLTAEARAQLQHRHGELFGMAHKVHRSTKPESPPGSQPFKATERKPLYDAPVTSTLFAEYYREGYDRVTRKSSRPSSAFSTQSQRQWANGPVGETGPSLGPGTYGKELPGTYTGRHVPSGHLGLNRTPDWSRTTPRPVSAPATRPPPASATFQGYYGPDAPTISLFPDDPEYGELNAVRFLQEKTSLRGPPGASPRRPPSQQQLQLQQQPQQAGAAAAAAAGAGGTAPDGGAAAAAGACSAAGAAPRRPLSYLGPEQFGELTSAGLAKRVPGGAFGTATREATCQAMRAVASPRVTPPAAVLVKAGTDLQYDYDPGIEGHRGRRPSWHLPANRNALSQQWMEAAATSYLS